MKCPHCLTAFHDNWFNFGDGFAEPVHSPHALAAVFMASISAAILNA